jgi:hypothetical protein
MTTRKISEVNYAKGKTVNANIRTSEKRWRSGN